ncbi:MAG: formate dehydrogenase accessory sulfurtransferase FdhD [Pseudomonadota bacterium]
MSSAQPNSSYRPELSNAGLRPSHPVSVVNERNERVEKFVPGEFPLTLKVDGREIVTLMTLGNEPEALTLGYIRNQKLFEDIHDIKSIHVDWDREQVEVTTHHGRGITDWEEKLSRKIVTSGCGQGTVFSCTIGKLYDVHLATPSLKQSQIYQIIRTVNQHNEVYRSAGAVHGCGLCHGTELLTHVEDVGRHNAADAISGMMWLDNISGDDKIFYTTGRLTSEIVMKAAFMGIPALLSRSGVTQMGQELAEDVGMTLIARAKGSHFLVYNGAENIEFDAIPEHRTARPLSKGDRDLDNN